MQIINTRSQKVFEKSHIDDPIHSTLAELRACSIELEKEATTVVYFNKGITGNAAQNIVINYGFKELSNLSGSNKNYQRYVKMLEGNNK